MATGSSTLSLRLPEKTRLDLDKAARETRRSRSYIVKEALDRHLDAILKEETMSAGNSGLDRLMELKERGRQLSRGRPAAQIDREAREFRGDE